MPQRAMWGLWLEEDLAPIPQAASIEPFVDAVRQQRNQLRSWWRAIQVEVEPNGRAVADFKTRLVPGSFFVLLGVIVALLVCGTIAPLLYLSARSDGSRALLFIPFALLSLAFFGFIASELRHLRSAGDLTNETF